MNLISSIFRLRLIVMSLLFVTGNFSMGFADWLQPPVDFNNNDNEAVGVGATDGNGNAIALWLDDSLDLLQASYYTNGVWQPNVTLDNIGSNSGGLGLAMDATDIGVAVWDSENFIRSAVYNDGWFTPTPQPLDVLTGPSAGQVVSMNGTGKAIAIWIDTGNSNVRAALLNNSGNWTAPITIGTGTGSPGIAYSANGTAMAVWIDGNNIVAKQFNGVTWETGIILAFNPTFLTVGIDAAGNAIAAWLDINGNVDTSVFHATTAMWQAPQIVSPTAGNNSLSLGVAPGGTAVLAWIDPTLTGKSISYNGTSWVTPLTFANTANFANVGVDNLGNALVIYSIFNSPVELHSEELPVGGAVWIDDLLVTTDTRSITNIISLPSTSGVSFGFWDPSIEGNNFFGSVLVDIVLPPASISGHVCNNRFVNQSNRINTITWVPSPDPTVVAYNLRRNGALIAVIPATGPFEFVDVGRCKREVDVYTLTSVNALGVESTSLTIILR